jgi:hypothetical protein
MLARLRPRPRRKAVPRWQAAFLAMLPKISHCARFAFRRLDLESRQEAIQSVVASSLAAYVRLVKLGKGNVAFATALAMYGIRQYRDGRRFGCRMNDRDISSAYCQQRKNFTLERLDRYDKTEDCWREILTPDQTCTPADLAASRIDFPAWLDTLSRRNRRIAEFLAFGNRTSDTARKFKVSEARVSQLREELAESWREFTGEQPAAVAA